MITADELYSFLPYAKYLCNGSRYDPYDLLHDTFIKLHSCQYEERGLFSPMVKTAMTRLYIDHWRKKRRVVLLPADFAIYFPQDSFIPEMEQEELTERAKARIAAYLCKLSERDKFVVESHIQGFTFKEIANMLSISFNTVGGIIFRIKNKMTAEIKKSLEMDETPSL